MPTTAKKSVFCIVLVLGPYLQRFFKLYSTLPVRFNGIERLLRFFIGEDYTTSREQFIFPEWKRGGSVEQDPRVEGCSSRTGCLGASTPPAP